MRGLKSVISQRVEKVKDPGLQSVADIDGDSLALLVTTATVGAIPRWMATMAIRRDAQLINAVSKLDQTHMGSIFVGRRLSEIGEQEHVCLYIQSADASA